MDTIQTPWEQLPDEPNSWFHRFEKFRLLEDRSVLASFNQWRLGKSRGVSTSAPKSWRDASKRWRWYERADAWDKFCMEQASVEVERQRIQIMQSGFALKHERVRVLNELATLLLGEIKEIDKRWCPDVKSIGSGEYAERVDIVRFNGSLIEQARKTLDDIAAELGERVTKQEFSGVLSMIDVTADELANARKKAQEFEQTLEAEDG